MTSIRDVAKLAGVSPSTVSRVINGTAKVDEEKMQRVLNAISETGFKPNEVARSLFKKSSRIIGVIAPDIENPFFTEMAKAIEGEAYARGYRMTLCYSENKPEKEKESIRMLSRMNADGIILMTNNEEIDAEVKDCGIPVVAVDRRINADGELAFVEADHYGSQASDPVWVQKYCKYLRTTEVFQCQRQISGICRHLQTVRTGSPEPGM